MVANEIKTSTKALIFDMDGTLLDTLPDIARSFNAVFKKNGFPCFTPVEYKKFIGSGLRNALLSALPKDTEFSEDELQILLQDVLYEYRKDPAGLTKPYNGIVDMLQILTDLGIKMSVLSNKDHELTVPIIKTFFPDIPFTEIIGKSDRFPLKPSPESSVYLINKMNSKPFETIMVGDSIVDFKTAVQAGMIPVCVSWGFNSVKKLRKAGCKILINSPSELKHHLINDLNIGTKINNNLTS
ncbi:MAG: HAD family hydrolase [Spirochaetales bacterium]|nr:HAD family hydrolase [Spirochaetales bacterium]